MNTQTDKLDRTSAALGLAAAIAVLFNTALAWVKDAYDPLNKFMASLTGHHWTTHGLADIAVFALLGVIFAKTGVAQRIRPAALVTIVIASVVVAGLGLAAWFVLV